MPKILIVGEKIIGSDSGAIATREGAKIWSRLTSQVAYCAREKVPASFQFPALQKIYSIRPHCQINHLISGGELAEFQAVLDEFRPTHIFYFGQAISKTAPFFNAAHTRGIRQIGLWLTSDFFCTANYGCLKTGPCKLCINGNYYQAFLHHCFKFNGNLSIPKVILQTVLRPSLARELKKCDVVMGSSRHQLGLYGEFGYPDSNIVQCPLFFDRQRVNGVKPQFGNYFVLYGQDRFEKGWHLFKDIANKCKGVKFVLPFASKAVGVKAIKKYGLAPMVNSGQVTPVYNVLWNTGVKEIVAASRGVIIPSIWPTTTEYTFLESLGLGKPIVVFDVGIHHEEIQDDVNGSLVPLNDVGTFASKIMHVYSDNKLAHRIGNEAKLLFEYLTDENRMKKAFQTALNLT